MKKYILGLMLMVSTLTSYAQCNWSKIGINYINKCGVVTFEMGSKDTCITAYTTYRYNFKTKKLDILSRDRVFTRTMDTGMYTFQTTFHNKCCNWDTMLEKYKVHIGCDTTSTFKCNWSTVKPSYTGAYKSYKFEISSYDTCLSYINLTIHNGKIDTIGKDRVFGITFKDTGVYYVLSRVHNKCTGCDTSYYIAPLYSHNPPTTTKCNWSKIGLGYTNKCGIVTFELGSKDTCITKYSLWSYRAKTGKLDTLAHDRVFTRTLDTGWYTFKASFHNKCCNSDTFIYKKVYIGCDSGTASTITLYKPMPKLIGIYDMMGRRVDYMRDNEIYIMKFDNGQSRKIMRVER